MRIDPETRVATGKHHPETYSALLSAIHRGRWSGVLHVRHEEGHRRLFFLAGEPVEFRSDLYAETLERAIVEGGHLPQSRVEWFEQKLAPGETLADALHASGVLEDEQINGLRLEHLVRGLGAPLAWTEGEWRFEPRPELTADQVQPELLLSTGLLTALWKGVIGNVPMDEVLPRVTDRDAGRFLPGPDFAERFAGLSVEFPLTDLPDNIGEGCTMEALARCFPERSGNLVKLLWLLEVTGMLRRENREATDFLALMEGGGTLSAATSRAKAAEPGREQSLAPPMKRQPPVREAPPVTPVQTPRVQSARRQEEPLSLGEQIAVDYRARMGRNYYEFVALDQESTHGDVKLRCRDLAQRWHQAAADESLSPEERDQVQELLRGIQVVWSTFTDRHRKEAYDQKLQAGEADCIAHEAGVLPEGDTEFSSGRPRGISAQESAIQKGGFWPGKKK